MTITVGPLSSIPLGEGREFEIKGERVAIFNTRSGQVFAVQANCPHRNGPLADGLLGGTILVCPLHSHKFDLATGEALMGDCKLRTYAAHVDEKQNIVITRATSTPP